MIDSNPNSPLSTDSRQRLRKYSRIRSRLRTASERFGGELRERLDAMQSLSTEIQSNLSGLADQHASAGEISTELRELKTERRDLESQLSELNATVDELRQTIDSEKSTNADLQSQLNAAPAHDTDLVASLEQQLEAAKASSDQFENEKKTLESEIKNLNADLEESIAKQMVSASGVSVNEDLERIEKEKSELQSVSEELTQKVNTLEKALADSNKALDEQTQLTSELSESVTAAENESNQKLVDEIESLEGKITFLNTELEELRKSNPKAEEENDIKLGELRSQLLDARREAVELRMQNTDLADQVARIQTHGAANGVEFSLNEPLSWEERKRRLLEQLEAEDNQENGVTEEDRNKIESIIEQTQNEIERRDLEIAELRQLMSEQSNAHDGIAVGAAAIAQMLDSDSVVEEERTKLQALQEELEEKLRKAEIETSRERAKLARERLELEESLREYTSNKSQTETEVATDTNARGRWLARLGLRDEKSSDG
jgi:DNA repair exonuclease SbcCD ATPase subunit